MANNTQLKKRNTKVTAPKTPNIQNKPSTLDNLKYFSASTGRFFASFFNFLKSERFVQVLGLACYLVAIFLLIAFISFCFNWSSDQSNVKNSGIDFLTNNQVVVRNALGRLGSWVSHKFIQQWFGISSFLFVYAFWQTGHKLLFNHQKYNLSKIYQYTCGGAFLLSAILGYIFFGISSFPFGGAVGNLIASWLTGFAGYIGAGLILLFALALILIMVFEIKIDFTFLLKNKATVPIYNALPDFIKQYNENNYNTTNTPQATTTNTNTQTSSTITAQNATATPTTPTTTLTDFDTESTQLKMPFANNGKKTKPDKDDLLLNIISPTEIEENSTPKPKTETATIPTDSLTDSPLSLEDEYDPTLDLSDYRHPILENLKQYGRDLYGEDKIEVNREELEKNKDQIVETLQNYGIEIAKIMATPGPTVTLYEIVPAPGIRISKIKNLENDIALSLAALGIRIIAPMPGKGTIGIEVPNQKREVVSLRSMLASEEFLRAKMDLPVAIGKTISDKHFVADLAKMPHLLMAGATGQGKSVCLNAILLSLLYKKHPAELKFVMIDPKKVELSLYNIIENHFLAKLPDAEEPIITDTKQVINTLTSLCLEMDQRYELLKNAQVRNIKEYNLKFKQRRLNPLKGHRFLPYIVLIIDEFADLIMTAGKDVEMPIARLAQLARAVGIHLVIATQRPTVNIITGTIKANFPVRIAFRVMAKVDSRTILDTAGAEQLVGNGDMLLSIGGDIVRLQGAFVDTPEVDRIVEAIATQQSYSQPYFLPTFSDDNDSINTSNDNNYNNLSNTDDMFEECARLVVVHQQGSTSLLQRRLKLGYNRAGRIMDQLEKMGIVGPSQGSKPREVYFADEYELDVFLQKVRKK